MLSAKINPISSTTTRAKSLESISDWFEQNLHSFYILGRFYTNNQQQMEELFYQSIKKVHKELPRYKSDTSFEAWVTSIFIHACREVAPHREEEKPIDLFTAMEQLPTEAKEAIILTYVKGLSKEDAAQILRISGEKLKELLFDGIRSLRKMEDDSYFQGCKQYYNMYIDYLERELERPKKIDFEMHIYHCPDCQKDLGTFQEVMLSMGNLPDRVEEFQIPTDFMDNIKDRFAEEEMKRRQKKQKHKKVGVVIVSLFTLLLAIGYFSGLFTSLYYTWAEEDEELRSMLQKGYGERLNLEAEDNGVKIKIKSVIADDVQTLIYYEIEDTENDNQYFMNYHDGVFVENEYAVMNSGVFPRYYPPDFESEMNDKKNVYSGKISLLPLIMDNDTIKLNITKLQKITRDSSGEYYGNMEPKTGIWSFEIPITKQPPVDYVLNQETEVEGIPVVLDKLIIAPTSTVLQFSIHTGNVDKRIDYLNFNHIEVNKKKLNPDLYSGWIMQSQQDMNWLTYQTVFDSFVDEKPKEVHVQFESAQLTFNEQLSYILDVNAEFPQTFEYGGSTISIDKLVVGQPSEIVLSNHDIKNREFESIHYNIVGEGQENISMEIDSEGVVVDKYGKEYDMYSSYVPWEEIEQPRHFQTVHRLRLHGQNPEESVIPARIDIYGYNATKYLDDVVKVILE